MTNKIEKITIEGTAPKFEANKLEELVAAAKKQYSNSTQCCVVVRSDIGKEFLQLVADKLNLGCTISPYPLNLGPINFNCTLIKSPEVQARDIAQIEVDVKEKYVGFLKSEHTRYQELLLAQLLQADELKTLKEAEIARAKLITKLQKEVAATFAPLEIPE